LTTGKYDIIFFFLAQTNTEVGRFVQQIRVEKPIFKKYKAKWFVTPYLDSFGYIPVRDEFLEIIKKKVEAKSKEHAYELLTRRDAIVMKELNSHADKTFIKIDEENKFDKGGADYSYHKLSKNGFVIRTTINATELPIRFNAVIILEIFDGIKFGKTRPDLLDEVTKNHKFTDKYAAVGDVEAPHSGILFSPIFNEDELEKTEEFFRSKIKGTTLRVLLVKKIILGSLCYRRFDRVYTYQYDILVKEYKSPTVEKINYEENSRASAKKSQKEFTIDIKDEKES
jgi:hypothetical protein